VGYCRKLSGLGCISAGFAPSPLRGEGWDEEWFNSTLNATNPTPHLASPPERGGIKTHPTLKFEIKTKTT
jgi:hypothetical protein